MTDWIARIRRCFDEQSVYYTRHAKTEMESEESGPILDAEVYEAIGNGEVIMEYLDDKPYPSALALRISQ
jgi:formylmethanofuran dehydrogenase subunit A